MRRSTTSGKALMRCFCFFGRITKLKVLQDRRALMTRILTRASCCSTQQHQAYTLSLIKVICQARPYFDQVDLPAR